jgi:hypothetical protein
VHVFKDDNRRRPLQLSEKEAGNGQRRASLVQPGQQRGRELFAHVKEGTKGAGRKQVVARAPQQPDAWRQRGGELADERRFADARFTAEQRHPAAARPRLGEQRTQLGELGGALKQLGHAAMLTLIKRGIGRVSSGGSQRLRADSASWRIQVVREVLLIRMAGQLIERLAKLAGGWGHLLVIIQRFRVIIWVCYPPSFSLFGEDTLPEPFL